MSEPSSRSADTWTLFGSVGAALGAAICCLGPVVLVSMGVTGAWIGRLSAIEAYRPFFMLAASGMLGWGFYRVYGTRVRDDCGDDGECEVPRASRINEVSLWIATVAVIGLFASPYLLGTTSGEAEARAQGTKESQNRGAATSEFETITLKVEGMTCGGCDQSVESVLQQQAGVERADVTFDPPRARVSYHPSAVNVDELSRATDEMGYASEPIQ